MATKPKVGQIKSTKPRFEDVEDDGAQFEGTRFYDLAPAQTSQPEVQKSGFLRGAGDVALSIGQGAVGAVKALTDLGGADNAASSTLGDAGDYLGDLKSDSSKATMQNSVARIKAAEESGSTWEEAKAYMGMLYDQPLEMIAQGAGSFATMGIGKAAQALKLMGAAKAAGVSKEVFMASAAGKKAAQEAVEFGFKANIGVGAGMGVGAVKGSQYEQTYNNAKAQGRSEEEAVALADEAQSYGGAGTMQQLLGGGLGALASATGPIEKLISGKATEKAGQTALMGAGKGFGTEFSTEGAQGSQERYAGNAAAIDAGVLDPSQSMRGVVGQGLQEGSIGGILGGGAGAFDTSPATPNTPVVPPGPMQRATTIDPSAQLAQVQSEEMGDPAVPQTLAPDGRAALLAQQDQQRLARAAEIAANRGMESPDDEIFAAIGAADQVRATKVPGAGPMSAAANAGIEQQALDIESGKQAAIDLTAANEADQAAYEQAMVQEQQQAAERDTVDKPVTSGTIAEAQMSEEDKRAMLYSNQPVLDGGQKFTGTQDGDVLNGLGAPFKTKMAALRRATMEGKDWTIAPVFDGFVARRKDAIEQDAAQGANPTPVEAPGAAPQAVEGDAAATGELPAAGSGALEGVGVKQPAAQLAQAQEATENIEPKFSLETHGWDERKLANSYDMEQLNQLYKEVRDQFSNKTVDGSPVTADGMATKFFLDDTGTQMHGILKKAQQIVYDRKNAAEAKAATQTAPAPTKSDQAKADVEHLFGLPDKRAKAIERIAKGTAYFTNPLKAGDFIAKNGLKDTHQAVKTGDKRWDIQAKSQPAEGANEPQASQAEQEKPQAPASEAAVAPKKGVKARIEEARQARADYFTPGNIVQGYSGNDRVISYKAPDGNGEGWNVTVQAVVKQDGKWIVDPKDNRVRTHSTMPEKADVARGPVEKAPAVEQVPAKAPDLRGEAVGNNLVMANGNFYRVDGVKDDKISLTRNPNQLNERPVVIDQEGYDKLVADAKETRVETLKANTAAKKPEIVVDKAEMRPYRKPDGSVGYEAVPIQAETPATPQSTSPAVQDFIDGKRPDAPTMDDVKAETPAPKPDTLSDKEKASKAKTPSADELRAKADLMNALADLGSIFNAPFKANITPEQEQKLLPVLTRVLDAAFRLGYSKFKDAAKFALDQIKAALGEETANALTLDHLQGAYIAMAGGKTGADTKRAVIDVEEKSEIEQHTAQTELDKSAEKADIETKDTTNDSGTEKQGSSPLDGVPAAKVGGTGSRGSGGRGTRSGSTSRRKGNSSTDDERGTPGRSGGDGSADADTVATGGTGRGRGIKGNGSGVPADSGATDVKLAKGGKRGAREGAPGLFTESGEVVPAAVPAANFTITPDLKLGSGGEVTKYKDNIAAIRALKLIESEHRRATADEQRVLARYVGWGGLANAFRNRVTGAVKADWTNEVAELESLLTAKELKAASASTPNAHYTSETVTGFMWRAAKRLGFNGGMVLEPSVGSGNFIGMMPADARPGSYVTGIELDSITARIASALYPQSNIVASGFEKLPLPDGVFDLAIGNPPFGKGGLRFQYNPKLNGKSIHNQFFLGSMDAVKPEGLQVMVVSRYLMDAQEKGARETLAIQAELLGAIRLPGSAFKGNAGTDVVTDILFLKKRTAEDQAALQFAFNERTAKVPAKEAYADKQARMARAAKLDAALAWTETTKVPDPLGGEPMVISQYFAKNPQMVAGVMDRSGSMQFGGDIDVKLPASELAAKLDAMMALLPSIDAVSVSEEIDQRTQAMHKALGESLSIMASGREIGSIYYDEGGALTEIVERVGVDGKTIVSKNTIDASTPWSGQLSMNMEGKWFKEVAQLDEKGEKVKVGVKINPKTGKPTLGRNVYVREVFANESDIPSGLRLGADGFAKLQKLVAIRELYVEQINLETNSASTGPMEANRTKLRAAYEAFVAAHGFISEQKNATIISEMPDEGLMLSLELKFRPAVTLAAAVKRGIKPSAARAEQNAILTRAVAIPPERKNDAASVSDAVAIVLGESGRIDVARVAELRKITEEEALAELTEGDLPMAYLDPETNEVTEKNQYLSGNVRKKLIAAQDTGMKRNVDALMKVQPEPWTSDKVTAHMGASWVPPATYADFVQGLLGRNATVMFSKISNTFEVSAPGSTAVDVSKWGTGRYPAVELLNDILNSRRIAVYDGGYKDVPKVLNETETQSAIDKKKEIIEEFDNWIFKDGDRRQELVKLFNDLYNTRVNRQYDGSHMDFPGKVPDSIIAFRRNQINAIWRGIVDRFTMYDHAVGAGKTFTGISRAMERKRMGLSNKPTIVVPNHLVSEWSTQAYRLYPGAKILAAGVKDLEPKNRRRLFAKIAAGDWDLVIVPHSSFKFIGISPETEERFINDELRVAQDALKEAEDDAEPGQRFKPLSVKAAEALILKLENRMDVVRGKAGKDQLLTFEQMGIDDLTVDESHEFKNLTYSTKLTDVRGLGPAAGSQKAFDLYTKMRILHETNGSAVFLTGTPISNSAVEMYTIMRYLAPDVLKENGLEHFDAFRAQFVQASEKPEPTEAGDGLKVVNRLGRNWSNMRSLMDGYYSVADVVTNDDIKAWYAEDNPGKVFPLPNVKGGGRRTVVAKPTPTQQLLIDELIAGYNGLPNIEDVKERNIARLRLMDKARKLALHAKVWDRALTDEPGGKLDKVVDESFRLYKAFEADKGTQLIFLDRSVPKAQGDDKQIKEYDALRAKLTEANANGDEAGQREAIEAMEKFDPQEIDELRAAQAGGWNAYQHMADGLIAKGVPKEQIAFIQNFTTDAQKKALFEAVNDGTIRFLFGSSQRMGAGMNVQERLVGLHHVDVTWKPSDIEQREGRIIRQGNLLLEKYGQTFEVEIMAYVTERSIDAKMWDLNSTKLRMVNGIRYYDGEFEMDFDDDAAIDMAEIAAIASGDPLMLERIKINTVIEELYRRRRSYNRRVESAGDSLRRAERDVQTLPAEIVKKKALMTPIGKAFQEATDDKYSRRVKVGDQEFMGLETALAHAEETIKIAKEGDSKRAFSLEIDGGSYTSEAGVMDAITEKMGDVNSFAAEIAGKKVIRRTAVARELRRLIGSEFTDIPTTPVGSLYGFPLSVKTEKNNFGSFVDLSVKVPYEGGIETIAIAYDLTPEKHTKGTSVTVLTSTLRAAMERLVDKLDSIRTDRYGIDYMERNLKDAKENIPTYREAAKEQFKQADELDAALTRLDDIQDQLQARAAAASAASAAPVAATPNDGAVFSTSDSPPEKQLPLQQIERLVQSALRGMKNAPNVRVVANPEAIGLRSPVDTVPSGVTLANGDVYVFQSGVGSPIDVDMVVFHELFHKGLQNVLPKVDYVAAMQDIAAADSKVRQYAGEWSDSKAAKSQMEELAKKYSGKELADQYEALATEEALARIAEDLKAKREMGSKAIRVRRLVAWLAKVADKVGMTRFADKLRALSYNEAERFVIATIGKAGGNGPNGGVRYSAPNGTSASEKFAANAKILQGSPIAQLFSSQAPKGGFADIEAWAASEFKKQGGIAYRDGLGEVALDERSAKSSMAHGGANKYKKVAFSVVKDVIERGALVMQSTDGREDSFYFSAPVEIDGVVNIETVLVHRDPNTKRMYLHSVTTKENLLNLRVSSADAEASERSGSTSSRGIASVLQKLLTFNIQNEGDIRFKARDIGDTLASAANNARDGLTKATVTDLKHQFGNRLADFRGLGLQTLGRRQLVDLYAGDLPQMEGYSRMVAQMDADKNESGAEADALATGWGKLKDERQLAELMHDATLAQFDADFVLDPADKRMSSPEFAEEIALMQRFKALTPEAKAAYRKARDMYSAHNDKVRLAVRERIERSEMSSAKKQALLKKMDGEFFKKVKGVYFPLARFGQYVTTVKDSAGNVLSANRSETMNEAEATRKILLANFPTTGGYKVGKVLKDKEFNAARDGVGRGFMADLFETLDKTNAGEELIDSISQLYLAALPDLSWAKHGIHRKGTPGFSQDARRAFAQNMFHGARYLAKLRYADQLQTSLDDMQSHIASKTDTDAFDSVKAQQVVDEMVKRHDSMMNPDTNPISTALTSFGFVFHLGLSPASALVNLSQTALVAYPVMGAKWGFGKASAALMNASRQAAGNKNDISKALTGEELEAYNEAVRAGVIDVTMAHDLAGIAQGEDSKVSAKIRPVMKAASFLFHHAEKFNRQVTFVAAYRLAKESGAGHLSAYDQAVKATYDGHFDYSASNRPRVMQGNVAKVVLLFKQYAQNMVYTLTRQAQLSLNGATPAERAEARKALGGLLASHALAAGALGLPMVGMLLSAASAIGGDDDEPWDAKVALQNMLADTLGQKPAEVFAHGLSRLTPWDISGRVGLDKLLLPDVQEGLEGADAVKNWMAAALGPVAGIAVNAGKGMQDMANGQFARGLESMLPSALRAPLKAYRYGTEGNIDKSGVAINDEIGAAGVAGQALGFSPSEARLAQEGKSAIYSADRAIQARRSSLTRQFALAAMAKDQEGMADARKDIARFNEKNPKARITPVNLMQSVRARRKRIEQAEQGVYLPKKRQDAIDAGRFAVAD